MKQCTPIKPHKYDKLEYLCAVQHFNCNIPKIEVEKNVKYLDTITPLKGYYGGLLWGRLQSSI